MTAASLATYVAVMCGGGARCLFPATTMTLLITRMAPPPNPCQFPALRNAPLRIVPFCDHLGFFCLQERLSPSYKKAFGSRAAYLELPSSFLPTLHFFQPLSTSLSPSLSGALRTLQTTHKPPRLLINQSYPRSYPAVTMTLYYTLVSFPPAPKLTPKLRPRPPRNHESGGETGVCADWPAVRCLSC